MALPTILVATPVFFINRASKKLFLLYHQGFFVASKVHSTNNVFENLDLKVVFVFLAYYGRLVGLFVRGKVFIFAKTDIPSLEP